MLLHLRIVAILFALLCHFVAAAQREMTVRLLIVDSFSKIPVADAFVQNDSIPFRATTNEVGLVDLGTRPPAALLVSRIGYESRWIHLTGLDQSGVTAVVYLLPKVASLAEVKINASGRGGPFTSISALQIHLRPLNNSQEVLRMVPGLFIGQHAGGGKSEQIFLRGFDIDHGTDINLSVDGMPVNMVSHAHGQGYADLHFLIPELIEKVTFNKGPYFADRGNFTTAGFVDFRTKNYLQNFVKAECGMFNTFRGVGGINLLQPGKGLRNNSLYLAGEASFTRGYFDSPQDFSRFNATLKYYGSVSEKTTLAASLTAFRSKWNASGQIPLRAVRDGSIPFFGAIDDTEGGTTARYNANLELTTYLQNGARMRHQVFYSRYAFELYSNFTFFKEDPLNGDQIRQKEKRVLGGYNGTFEKAFSIGKYKAESSFGVQLRHDDVSDVELSRTKGRDSLIASIQLGDVTEFNAGGYVAQKLWLSSRLEITAALRSDYIANRYTDKLAAARLQSHSAILSPKFNIDYRVNDQVQLYFYNGRGFHSNDTRVAVQKGGKDVLPAAYGTDLGAVFKPGTKWLLQAAAWYLWLEQEFIYVGDEGIVEAGGQSKRIGLDASARYEIFRNLFADVDISVARPRAVGVAKETAYLPLTPAFTSVGGLTYRTERGLNGSLRYRFMGDRPANEDYSTIADGYFVCDAALGYSGKNWQALVSVQNIFNTRWKETQFETESRLQREAEAVSEIHFTPGTPFFLKAGFTVMF